MLEAKNVLKELTSHLTSFNSIGIGGTTDEVGVPVLLGIERLAGHLLLSTAHSLFVVVFDAFSHDSDQFSFFIMLTDVSKSIAFPLNCRWKLSCLLERIIKNSRVYVVL